MPPLLIEEPVTQDEIRERRIQYFDNQSVTPVDVNDDNKIIRVNRMKVREDMIKHFLTEEVCIFLIMSVVLWYHWHFHLYDEILCHELI